MTAQLDPETAALLEGMFNDPKPIYKGYTHKQLTAAFAAVEDPDDWRGPICAAMPGEAVLPVVAAIEFFTATTPTVQLDTQTMTYYVSSIGYRAGPAGDH